MEQLKSILTTACMLSLTIGLCNVLKPGLIFDKQLRFLISLLFVLGLASPILSLKNEGFHIAIPENAGQERTQALAEEMQESILYQTGKQTEAALYKLLREKGIVCSELQVRVHIDEGQCIYISEVSAVCDQTEYTCEILRASLGEEVMLHVSEIGTEIQK